jgi:hypothetical protein
LFEVVPKSRFGYPKLITMPDDRIESKFALLAWDWKLETDTFDQAKFIGFYRSHVDRGPENAG